MYGAAVLAAAAWVAKTLRQPTTLPLAALLIVVLHVMYGAGVVRGLVGGRGSPEAPDVLEWTTDEPTETATVTSR